MTTTDAHLPGAVLSASAQTEVACDHCGLPVPHGLFIPKASKQFCCNGCKTVFEIIHENGLDRYYALRDQALPARTTDRKYDEFDDPTFADLYYKPLPDGRIRAELCLEGMHCAACVWLLEKLPHLHDGLGETRVDFGRSLISLNWNPDKTSLAAIARLIDSLGYPAHAARNAAQRQVRLREDRRSLIRIALAGAAAANVMLISFALYGAMFSGMDAQIRALFHWASLGLGLIALAWPGSVFYRGAWAALRTKTLHMDLPIALGLTAGGVSGAISTIRGTGEIYFDSVTAVVFLLLVGRWFQQRQQRAAADAVELLYSLTPGSARVIEDGQTRQIPIEAVVPGMILEVLPGETLSADGVIIEGRSELDQAMLTGESKPITAIRGQAVHAGTVNLSSPIRIRTDAAGENTRIGRLMQMVEQCAKRRAPVVQLADRISGVFVATVLTLAAITLAIWLVLDPPHAVTHAAALLIVTCPCALGLATPLAVVVAIGRAAKRGILIKGGDALENLTRPGLVLIDKTGTITQGKTQLIHYRGADDLKPIIGAIEANATHPLGAAFVNAFGNDTNLTPQNITQITGSGIRATLNGHNYLIGSASFVRSQADHIPEWADQLESDFTRQALTPVFIAVDGAIQAAAGIGDPIRPDAKETIRLIKKAGWQVAILSGDHPGVVQAIASQLQINPEDARGDAGPEDKLTAVQAAQKMGPVVMIGDGINDAAALSAATVGIAVHGGAEASLAAADVYLNRAGLAPLNELLIGADRTMGVIRRNLGASLLYNAVCASLAMAGLINPLIAAIMMPASSVTVVMLSCRSRTFGAR